MQLRCYQKYKEQKLKARPNGSSGRANHNGDNYRIRKSSVLTGPAKFISTELPIIYLPKKSGLYRYDKYISPRPNRHGRATSFLYRNNRHRSA